MPYPYRCGAVKSFPEFGKCNYARADHSGHYYCRKVREIRIGELIKTYYLPCLFQKKYRKGNNRVK
jgi:hypothetical protein